jgi:3-hydroxy-9,10-secoandrosta-1,3,5(10)-triene-9,17-dione monooxygenase reductase component
MGLALSLFDKGRLDFEMKLRHDMLTHGVYIVCAQYGGRRGGLAVAWATQIATDRILICVGKQSATRELILASKAFGLSVLTREQVDIARAFGSPLLDDCATTLDCRVEAVHDQGDEKLIVGHIVAAERLEETYEPLIYREEDY